MWLEHETKHWIPISAEKGMCGTLLPTHSYFGNSCMFCWGSTDVSYIPSETVNCNSWAGAYQGI